MATCLAWLAVLAADPGEPGPHQVGTATMILDDVQVGLPGLDRPRTLLCELWFPVSDPRAPRRLRFAWESLPVKGRWPVVLFSHGLAAWGAQSESLCRHWASHGFVVVAVDHPGTCARDLRFWATLNSARARPKELSAVLDALAAMDGDPDSPWHGRVDTTRVAAAGHSFGGGTALALAGAPLDTRRFPRYGPMPDPQRPEFLDLGDARVQCALAFAPGTEPFFSDESLAKLAKPTLILDGDRDPITPPERHGARVFRLAAGPREYGVLRGAGHISFFDPKQIPFLSRAVRAQHWPTMPDARAEALIRAVTLSFLDRQLRRGAAFPTPPQAPDLAWRVAR